ncbi:uncharacterized protein LOC132057777 [Lycium ferocissimum]|uniref:uncharacterized protein LOC132057777 n=1 Tax=Lycium ferocissimum TaxID=112874 RepID=UPI002815AEB1|nr:uncharacterized protein LOC132057777 [Lycium ferocissimum]
MCSLSYLWLEKKELAHELHQLASLGVRLLDSGNAGVTIQDSAASSLVAEVKERQYDYPMLVHYRDTSPQKNKTPFEIISDRVLRHRGKLCVPDIVGLRRQIMGEAHYSSYSIHPGTTKIYHDVKEVYWWDDFNGSWDDHLPLVEFAFNNSYHSSIQMAPYKALYGQKYRSPLGWFEVGESKLIGPDFIQQAVDKAKLIQERLLAAQSHQKSYTDNQRRDLEFQVDDWVAYELDLPSDLESVHLVFHVSMFHKFIGDPSRVIPVDGVQVTEQLSYEEVPIAILDRQVRRLRTKDVASVKVLWRNKNVEEMTWEAEEDMRS